MKVVTPEGYTFVTKFQEDNSHKVLRSVDFFSIKFDEILFDTVCWGIMLQLHITNIDIASHNDASCISTLCVDCNNSVMHVR